MLGWIGKWSGSKGMAKVPNLLGLNRGQARQALQNAGFKFGNETEDVQSDQSLTDKVKNQGIPQDTLLEYESSVDYVLYAFSFVPYSFTPQTPYSFTPASYSFTPQTPYSFTPEAYSFTPYSFTPYSFTPQAVTCGECQNDGALIIIPVCDGEDSVEGFFQPQSQFCSDGSKIACPNVWTGTYGMLLEANSRSCGGSGYSFVPYSFTPYSFTPYSFTPYSFTPQAYSFTPQSNGCPAPGEWGPWSACVNGTRTRTRTNYDDVPGCPPYIESETENCTTPYTFTPQTPYTFTPQAYSFTPFSFIPQSGVYTFTPETPYTFTPQAYSFTPFSFIPQTAYSFVPQTAYSFVPQTPYSFVPQSYSFTPAAFAFVPQFMS